MDDRIAKLKIPQECEALAKNALARDRPDLAMAAKRRAVQIRAESYGANSDVERECIEAIFAYEEVLPGNANRQHAHGL